MQKQKEKSAVQWILEWAGRRKSFYIISVALAVLNVAFKIFPYFIIGNVIAKLLLGERDIEFYIIQVVFIAVSFVLSEIFRSISTSCSHKATFAVLAEIRKQCLDNLQEFRLDMLKTHRQGPLKI